MTIGFTMKSWETELFQGSIFCSKRPQMVSLSRLLDSGDPSYLFCCSAMPPTVDSLPSNSWSYGMVNLSIFQSSRYVLTLYFLCHPKLCLCVAMLLISFNCKTRKMRQCIEISFSTTPSITKSTLLRSFLLD